MQPTARPLSTSCRMVSMWAAVSRACASRTQAVADEHPDPAEALREPGQRALLHLIRHHQGVTLSVAVRRLRDAVPAPVPHDGEGVAGRRPEGQPLGPQRAWAVAALVKDRPEPGLGLVPRQVELHGDGLAPAVAVDANAIAAKIAEEHGHRVEREAVDAALEPRLERRAELGLEGLLEGPRAENARQLPPEGALAGGQPHDVLRQEVELAPRAVPVRLHRLAVA